MKLISLNTWGAAQGQVFFDYINQNKAGTDVFCFQEVFLGGEGTPEVNFGWRMFSFTELQNLLPDFNSYFAEKSSGYADDSREQQPWPIKTGMAMFVKKAFPINSYSSHIVSTFLAPDSPPIEGNTLVQAINLQVLGKNVNILNFHGMSRPGSKVDTKERIEQSQNILNVISKLPKDPLILCGDFNLNPDTESIKMLEGDLKNLIKEYNIETTRNEISWKQYNNKQYFADFAFISKEIKVLSFKVPYNLVSDHLPMELEFNLG